MGTAERVRGIIVKSELGELGEGEAEDKARVAKGNRETRAGTRPIAKSCAGQCAQLIPHISLHVVGLERNFHILSR